MGLKVDDSETFSQGFSPMPIFPGRLSTKDGLALDNGRRSTLTRPKPALLSADQSGNDTDRPGESVLQMVNEEAKEAIDLESIRLDSDGSQIDSVRGPEQLNNFDSGFLDKNTPGETPQLI